MESFRPGVFFVERFGYSYLIDLHCGRWSAKLDAIYRLLFCVLASTWISLSCCWGGLETCFEKWNMRKWCSVSSRSTPHEPWRLLLSVLKPATTQKIWLLWDHTAERKLEWRDHLEEHWGTRHVSNAFLELLVWSSCWLKTAEWVIPANTIWRRNTQPR